MEGCKRYRGPQFGPPIDPVFTCDAFPLGIPEEILSGDNPHTAPVDGDGGKHYVKSTVLIKIAEKEDDSISGLV